MSTPEAWSQPMVASGYAHASPKSWESKTCKALAVMFTPHTWNLSSCVCVDHHKRCKAYTSLLDWKHDQISHAGHMSIAVASHLQHLQKPHAHDMHPKRFYFRI